MNQSNPEPNSNPVNNSWESLEGRSLERLLIEASHILNADLELQPLMKNVLRILIKYLNAEASAIFLSETRGCKAELFTYTAEKNIISNPQMPEKGVGIAAQVMETRNPAIVNNIGADENLKSIIDQRVGLSARNLIAVPVINKDQLLGVIEVVNKRDGAEFTQNDLETMKALGEQIALAVANSDLICDLRRKNIEAQSLYEVGKLLSGKLELEDLLILIIEQVINLVKANLATIYLVDPKDGSIKEAVSSGLPEGYRAKLSVKIGEGITGWVAKTGQSAVINDVNKDRHYIPLLPETKSEIAVPLLSRGRVVGVFNVESEYLNAYSNEDLALLETFASEAAVSIERALLYKQTMEQKSFKDELEIARRIQATFLPKESPQKQGYDISGLNIPSEAVGGDYYDFIDIVERQMGVAIGDVSGKGIGAALIMATFRASLKAEIRNNFAIRTILAKTNALLYESIERENYVTAVYGVLDVRNHIFTYSNAGHPPPLLFRANGEVVELSQGGYAVGMFRDSAYEEASVYLSPKDMLLLYTDGITEAFNDDEDEFGYKRMREAVTLGKDLSSKEIIQSIVDAVKKFKAPEKQLDDLTMILIKCL
jgi:sigma-B regulation protein RsbU (phosphoserine phosphatase)